MGRLGRKTRSVQSISTQTRQEGIKCTKAKEQMNSYCTNTYTVKAVSTKGGNKIQLSRKGENAPPCYVTGYIRLHLGFCMLFPLFIKFRFSKKATKFETISHKSSGTLFQIFVAFSEYPNFRTEFRTSPLLSTYCSTAEHWKLQSFDVFLF